MDSPALIRVVMADDHRLFLDGLRRLLEEQPDLTVAAAVATGAEALEAARREHPDVLLLDIDMPDGNAFAVADRLKEDGAPAPRIILLTMHNEPPYVIAASRPDVQGFVLKDAAFEELVEAIRKVHAGGRYIGAGVTGALGDKCPLSAREIEILRCAAHGMTTQETSEALKISVKTVETHRGHILQKLNAPNMTTAVHLMDRRGL
ncbi:MAG: response regulator transcription factor [Kiritimatiellae bacterium]|nr:response regulator transcription factor [Kiritimatiellia bacterium]